MNQVFFELLQISIGNRKELSESLADNEWLQLFETAKKQALLGICFVGVQQLRNSGTQIIPDNIWFRWLGVAVKTQQKNKEAIITAQSVVDQLNHDGLKCCILKGLSNSDNFISNFTDSSISFKDLRSPGDIDLWCAPFESIEIAVCDLGGESLHYELYSGKRGVIEYALLQARLANAEVPQVCYHHTDLKHNWDVNVELHHRPTYLCSPLRNHLLNQWLEENEQFGVRTSSDKLPIPTNSFNAIYQLIHIYRHLLDEGIGLRQLLDYYFVLRALHVEQGSLADRTESMAQWDEGMGVSVKSNAEIMHVLGRLGMKRFASAVMYALQKVFAMPDAYLLCAPDAKAGAFLLDEIMLAGNFGQHDDRVERGKHNAQNVWVKMKRNWKFLKYYPEEVMWEPLFRVYHHYWRAWELWRF